MRCLGKLASSASALGRMALWGQQMVPAGRLTLSSIWGALCVASDCVDAGRAQRASPEVGIQGLQAFLTFCGSLGKL